MKVQKSFSHYGIRLRNFEICEHVFEQQGIKPTDVHPRCYNNKRKRYLKRNNESTTESVFNVVLSCSALARALLN